MNPPPIPPIQQSALIKCSDCNNDVSRRAASCPKCGAPMAIEEKPIQQKTKPSATPKRQQSGGALFLISICTGVIGIFIWPLLIVAGILLLCAVFSTKLECGNCSSKIESRQKICGVCQTPVAQPKSSILMIIFLIIVMTIMALALLPTFI